tara:strand:- start:559 stop:777 length:219 start_codon:yes stop_codon:yes gene_type:complete
MKVTKPQLKKIIAEAMGLEDFEGQPKPDLSPADQQRFIDAYYRIQEKVEGGTIPESVEDAYSDLLALVGIYL